MALARAGMFILLGFLLVNPFWGFGQDREKPLENLEKIRPAANPGTNTDVDTDANTVTGGNDDPGDKPGINMPMEDSVSFFKSLMALTFVLGLIFLSAYFFKKITGMKTSGLRGNRIPIHLVGNLPLGEKKFLSIVEIQGSHYFLGISQNSINLLSKLDLDPDEPGESAEEKGRDFDSIFRKARLLLQQGIKIKKVK